MKLIIIIFLLLSTIISFGQQGCIDSSSHLTYQSLLKDSFNVEKITITKSGDKVFTGKFYNYNNSILISYIGRIKANGNLLWLKKVNSSNTNGGSFELESIEEANNGNLFISFVANSLVDDRPFFFIVLSPNGSIINQKKIGFVNIIPAAELPPLGDKYARAPLISKLSNDSMLLGYYYLPNDSKEPLILITTDNTGNLGSSHIFKTPQISTYLGYFNNATCNNNIIKLYGSGGYYANCDWPSSIQTTYYNFEINWLTKQVINKKAYCNPNLINNINYTSAQGGGGSFFTRHRIFPQANGNVIYTRSAMGGELSGTDTINRIFAISEFDSSFNHIKSEYITTGNNFKRNCYYGIFIDSFNNRHIQVHDQPNNYIYYAIGDKNNNYLLQKRIPFNATQSSPSLIFQNFKETEYLTSFNMVSINNNKSKFDNFRILARDTAQLCFGENSSFLGASLASPTPINWQGNFEVTTATVDAVTPNIVLIDYGLTRNIICNIVNKCDTILINVPDTVCNATQPIKVTAHKNALCNGKVNFIFDTTQVESYNQINDTTILLKYNKNYTAKIYAQPSTCNKLIDSASITIIIPEPNINLGNDTLYCPKSIYKLNAYNPKFKNYKWQNGSTDSAITAITAGTYFVTAYDYCNRIYTDTINIMNTSFSLEILKDTSICLSESVLLKATPNFLNYTWQPITNLTLINSSMVEVSPLTTTNYNVKAEKFTGCFLSDTVEVKVENCPQYIYFPSSFTPNGDRTNDIFKPVIGGVLSKFDLKVYNRWGELVFYTNNKLNGWNGNYKNSNQPIGTYIWTCDYQFLNKPKMLKKGTITLLK